MYLFTISLEYITSVSFELFLLYTKDAYRLTFPESTNVSLKYI